ncbi:BAG family molecular chaperone regulator 3 [Sesbania bispinosa]|nr:BAG family molecular chaperone regulator 3 [Sesbania bispinosa]
MLLLGGTMVCGLAARVETAMHGQNCHSTRCGVLWGEAAIESVHEVGGGRGRDR